MAEVSAPAAVSLSRPPGIETPRHLNSPQDSAETSVETVSLKALARLVLTRDTRLDSGRDKVSRQPAASETPPETVETPAPSWGEREEERAAIVEHDGKIPRAWAEGYARLHPDCPPGDVPLRRWHTFIDDIGRFLDSPFCAVAAALGWGPHDLFGCDRDRPFARIDRAGLLWLLNGDRLVMLADDAATIETRTGVRQTWRRKLAELGRVLAWELAR